VGGLNTDFFESGNIGATTTAGVYAGGAIVSTTYIATDSAVTAAGIGSISVLATIPPVLSSVAANGISDSTFISNAGIGDISVSLEGLLAGENNSGISASNFLAGHALGSISVFNDTFGATGAAYGIANSTFNAGIGGYGGTGDIDVVLSDHAEGDVRTTAAIYNSNFDASVCACMSASMGSIYAQNYADDSNAAGIVDSVFSVHGNIGPIGATMGSPTGSAIEGSTFSAFGSIGDINVYGSVYADANGPSRFMGQSFGNVTVSGYFDASDIITTVNAGSASMFGDSNVNASAAKGT